MILEIKNLVIQVQNYDVIRDVSFSLKEGEKLGIVGESGSGKTLLMRSLIGLLPSSVSIKHGTIKYGKMVLSDMKEAALQKVRGKEIGMVFQDPLTYLNPTRRVGVQIAEGYLRHFPKATATEAKQVAYKLLQEVQIADPALRFMQYPHELSGGLRQRVLIAIALAAKPKLLIADEPTTALDVTVQAQIMDLLRNLQRDKTTILVTHDLSLVASFCNRVIVMYAGQIVEDASLNEIFSNPRHPYTIQLLKSIPSISSHEKLTTISGSPPDLSQKISGCPFVSRCQRALKKCHERQPPLISINHEHQSACWLEDSSC